MPPERIVPLPSSENFWSVGGPGPCGPDSEIYFDWGAEVGCPEGCLPGCSRCERFLEFWNLVFMSYELHPDRTLTPIAEAEHRHGHGPRAARPDRPERPVRLRHRRLPGDHELDRRRLGRRVRGFGRRDQGPPRPRRPRARDDLPGGRGDHAVERGAGLRAPAHRPPRGPARAADRHGGAVRRRAVGRRDRADGRRVPGAGGAPRPDRTRPPGRGGALLGDARARDEAVRGGGRRRRDLAAPTPSRSRRPTASRSS